MTADPSAAADTLRDELARMLLFHRASWSPTRVADVLLPVVLRYADAQVAAEREAWWRNLIGVRVNRGTVTDPDWYMHHPSDVELVYPADEQP